MPLDEIEIISYARRFFKRATGSHKVALGIGDDCASLRPASGYEVLASTDTLAEAVHFLRDLSTPEDIGAKSVHTAISDIAAMGGRPLALLLSVNLHDVDHAWISAYLRGAGKAARQVGAPIVGGNVTAAASLSFTVTALGEVKKGLRVDRSGARPGDAVYITGYPGESVLGLDLMTERKRRYSPMEKHLIDRHLLPTPRLEWGRLLAERKIASAMIDISDGVALDFRRLIQASDTGGRLWLEKFPISAEAMAVVSRNGEEEALCRMMTGGEDYELLFTVRPAKSASLERLIRNRKMVAHKIGEITREKGKLEIFGKEGKRVDFQVEGWLHR
ncbi:MAG: thiamine-phosphate kinase [Nitrospinota bacterium]|nr:thiamine-phosphate kinase [Nitrospinota bacterium]